MVAVPLVCLRRGWETTKKKKKKALRLFTDRKKHHFTTFKGWLGYHRLKILNDNTPKKSTNEKMFEAEYFVLTVYFFTPH